MEKIGNKSLMYSKDFIVPEGEQIEIIHNVDGWNLKLTIKFEPKAEKQGVAVKPVGDAAEITLMKWDNSLGTAITEPAELGTHHSGKKLYFSAVNYCIAGTNKLTFQLLMGESV